MSHIIYKKYDGKTKSQKPRQSLQQHFAGPGGTHSQPAPGARHSGRVCHRPVRWRLNAPGKTDMPHSQTRSDNAVPGYGTSRSERGLSLHLHTLSESDGRLQPSGTRGHGQKHDSDSTETQRSAAASHSTQKPRPTTVRAHRSRRSSACRMARGDATRDPGHLGD